MTALALRSQAQAPGLVRSARLMRALGPDAGPVWAQLAEDEAAQLSAAMAILPPDPAADADAVRAFTEASRLPVPVRKGPATLWQTLSGLGTDSLLAVTATERAQTLAVILSRLNSEAAARLIRALPSALAIEAMHRLLHLSPVNPAALRQLEVYLETRIGQQDGEAVRAGHERIARIFDRLDERSETIFLAALENTEPGAGEKVRALMFTFDDLCGLDAGGLQTLLAHADRAAVVIALKGAAAGVSAAFFNNMTARAGELLREEIAALGPVRRSEVDAARQEIVALTRALIHRGEIRHGGEAPEDELVE